VYADSNSGTPTVTHVTATRNTVMGVASVGDDLFVLHGGTSQEVEVYNFSTSKLQRHIRVPGRINAYDLAVCKINKCLYIPDRSNNTVHRVELSGSNAVTKWSVASCPAGVSVNREHNVLVVSEGERKLQVFNTHGTLLQDVKFQAGIDKPQRAVQLANGQLVVSSDACDNQLCLIGMDGQLQSVYKEKGSSVGKMNAPRGIAVDKHNNVLLADMNNNRLLVFNQSLTRAQVMPVRVNGGFKHPRSLWYDQLQRRLYIGQLNSGRVIVINSLKDFFSACTS